MGILPGGKQIYFQYLKYLFHLVEHRLGQEQRHRGEEEPAQLVFRPILPPWEDALRTDMRLLSAHVQIS